MDANHLYRRRVSTTLATKAGGKKLASHFLSVWLLAIAVFFPGCAPSTLPAPTLIPNAFPPLPDPIGFAGSFVGVHNGALIVAGGANFPDAPPWEAGKKVWHDRIHVMTRDASGAWQWRTAEETLSLPLAYGVSVSTPRGILCVGGCDSERSRADAFLLRWNADRGRTERESLPPFPVEISFAGGAVLENIVYVVGGKAPDGESDRAWALTLGENAWHELPPLPAPPRLMPTVVSQSGRIYVFSGRTGGPLHELKAFTDAWAFDPNSSTWTACCNVLGKGRKGEDGVASAATPAVAWGKSQVLLFGGGGSHRCSLHKRIANAQQAERLRAAGDARGADALEAANHELMATDPGHALEILSYDTVADAWEVAGKLPADHSVVAARAERLDGTIVIPTGETRPGVRTRRVMGFGETEQPGN